uniref:Uncharacterized protein n=1 Tax=Peronospora matthiolae TaxID=2874970 RepID=A0AAV1U8T6_9STRA
MDADADELIDQTDWVAFWEMLESAWFNPLQILFPTASSSTSELQRVASQAPGHLIWLVKRFTIPGELLWILDLSVFVQTTAESRRSFLERRLWQYREQPFIQSTITWLDCCISNTQHRNDYFFLAPLVDSSND